jgi:hypothetical protein
VIPLSKLRIDNNSAPANAIHTQERVMKKIAFVSIALAVLAGTPAFARVNHHQQQSWTRQQADTGYYDPSRVRPGDVPFAPF